MRVVRNSWAHTHTAAIQPPRLSFHIKRTASYIRMPWHVSLYCQSADCWLDLNSVDPLKHSGAHRSFASAAQYCDSYINTSAELSLLIWWVFQDISCLSLCQRRGHCAAGAVLQQLHPNNLFMGAVKGLRAEKHTAISAFALRCFTIFCSFAAGLGIFLVKSIQIQFS